MPDAPREVEGAGEGAAEPAGVELMEMGPGVAEAEAASVVLGGACSVDVWIESGSGFIGGSC